MAQQMCEFEELIHAQGAGYRCAVWARSRRCIVLDVVNLASLGVAALVVGGAILGFPALIASTEQQLASLIHL